MPVEGIVADTRLIAKLQKEVQTLTAERADVGKRTTEASLPDAYVADTERLPDIQDVIESDSPDDPLGTAATSKGPISPLRSQSSPTHFDPLEPSILDGLCTVWFQQFHAWFPILHQPSLVEILQTLEYPASTAHHIIFKAVAAVTILHWNRISYLTDEQRQQLSNELRDSVILEAMGTLCLQSLQAVLILTIREWGTGRLSEFWNLVALAKRS